jgi:hypothetical protein
MEREYVPCPTCTVNAAEVIPPANPGDFPRSRCIFGHECSLIPDVLTHLRQIRDLAEQRWRRESA